MERVFIHPLAGVLSAYGMGLADQTVMREAALEQPLGRRARRRRRRARRRSPTTPSRELARQGVARERIVVHRRVHLRYEGTDSALVVPFADEAGLQAAFEAAYRQRFAFLMRERAPDRRGGLGRGGRRRRRGRGSPPRARRAGPAPVAATVRMFSDGRWHDAALVERAQARPGRSIAGPAIIAERNATTIVEPGWPARVTALDHLVLERDDAARRRGAPPARRVDPVLLEVFNNLFMNIAEQMGLQLQNTAYSVNIKERLDFSCALFDADGNLIANAPHMPVHLGSMSESIKTVIARNAGTMQRGDVYVLNDPYHGGTHLPDVTVVTPVYLEDASDAAAVLRRLARPPRRHRRHHAGLDAAVLDPHRGGGRAVRQRQAGRGRPLPRGRDARAARERPLAVAQPGAEHRRPEGAGRRQREGRARARADGRRSSASTSCRPTCSTCRTTPRSRCAASSRALKDGAFTLPLDNGAQISVAIRVDAQARSAEIDFTGTSAQLDNNFNAPTAVCMAAVLYVFRTLVDDDIPLNAGCLKPIKVIIPEGSMLNPRPPASVVAGNVETSTCITNALYGALGVMASAQCTMNNFTFGNARHQYYETIAGGSGAGLVFDGEGRAIGGFDGTSVVQTHMTNSRLTDPEVLEFRFPVRLDSFELRAGSGGAGRWHGGDGGVRRVRFLEPMTASILSNGRHAGAFGIAGGSAGRPGINRVERADGSVEALDHIASVEMAAGDVFVIETPGGGGCGSA